ncbi:unnamed protein product [Dracunculus medinensis]|uniref:7TM_GPCR_Srx domain-containing protein n=1 Tax=Dracunculus medinensis TaxID=318479 RepID=A0A0N4UBA5_DRAME|nr:unnamed protein product [Dracunculus medinensis]
MALFIKGNHFINIYVEKVSVLYIENFFIQGSLVEKSHFLAETLFERNKIVFRANVLKILMVLVMLSCSIILSKFWYSFWIMGNNVNYFIRCCPIIYVEANDYFLILVVNFSKSKICNFENLILVELRDFEVLFKYLNSMVVVLPSRLLLNFFYSNDSLLAFNRVQYDTNYEAFMSYILVWVQMSFWAYVVFSRFLRFLNVVPFYGYELVLWYIYDMMSSIKAILKIA